MNRILSPNIGMVYTSYKREGNPEGKANPGSPELLLEVYHSLLFYLHGKKCEGMSLLSYPRCEGMGLLSHLW